MYVVEECSYQIPMKKLFIGILRKTNLQTSSLIQEKYLVFMLSYHFV